VELKQRLDRGDKLTIVDVREPNEYQINRIRGLDPDSAREIPRRYAELNKETSSSCSASRRREVGAPPISCAR
jgi:rhodanese-related sulfurtransferase